MLISEMAISELCISELCISDAKIQKNDNVDSTIKCIKKLLQDVERRKNLCKFAVLYPFGFCLMDFAKPRRGDVKNLTKNRNLIKYSYHEKKFTCFSYCV